MNEPHINSGPHRPTHRSRPKQPHPRTHSDTASTPASTSSSARKKPTPTWPCASTCGKRSPPKASSKNSSPPKAVTAAWRLRRCRTIELTLSGFDGKPQEQIEKEQKSVDRARGSGQQSAAPLHGRNPPPPNRRGHAHANSAPRGLMISDQPGLIDSLQFVSTLRNWTKACIESANAPLPPNDTTAAANTEPESSFCKSAAAPSPDPKSTPRKRLLSRQIRRKIQAMPRQRNAPAPS